MFCVLDVACVLFMLDKTLSTSVVRAGEGVREGSLLASVTARGPCRLWDRSLY